MNVDEPRQDPIEAAQLATHRAAQSATGPSDWDDAVTAWDDVLRAAAGQAIQADVHAALLAQAAGPRLQRSWFGGPTAGADAAAAADLYQRAANLVAVDSPDQAAYLSNLGLALRQQWECEKRPHVLNDAVMANQAAVSASDATTRVGVACRLELGKTLRERYDVRRDHDDLVAAAVVLAVVAQSAATVAPEMLAESHETLGNARFDLYRATGDATQLDKSVHSLRRALDLVPPDGEEHAMYASNLGSALLGRFGVRGDRDDLDDAIRLLEQAVASEEERDGPSAQLLANLSNALGVRAGIDASREDADQAVHHLRQAVDFATESARKTGIRSNLATALLERLDLTGEIVDLDEAIDLLEAAVAESAPDDPDRLGRLSNLGSALRRRQLRRRGGREDVDQAVSVFEQALAATQPTDPDRAAYHANLGNALHQRYDVTGDPNDLDRAVRELEAAAARTPSDSADRAPYLNNLGATLAARGERLDSTEDFERAAALLRQALDLSTVVAVNRAGMLVNLANAVSELFARRRRTKDRDDAIAAYRMATQEGIATNPADALSAAQNWIEWAEERQAWAEVVEAHSHGQRAAEHLFRGQILRTDKESWLRDAAGLATEGAFARTALDDHAGAVVALESGRGMLYSERLEREKVDLRRLEADHEDIAERYRIAADRVTHLENLSVPSRA